MSKVDRFEVDKLTSMDADYPHDNAVPDLPAVPNAVDRVHLLPRSPCAGLTNLVRQTEAGWRWATSLVHSVFPARLKIIWETSIA
jgi:hypothetical protein